MTFLFFDLNPIVTGPGAFFLHIILHFVNEADSLKYLLT